MEREIWVKEREREWTVGDLGQKTNWVNKSNKSEFRGTWGKFEMSGVS